MPRKFVILTAVLILAAETGWANARQPPKPAEPEFPKLEGAVVAVDPGHGGHDQGIVIRGVQEKRLILEIAMKLKERLAALEGVSPYLTRESDEFVQLSGRVIQAEGVGASVFVSLHIDNAWGRKARGVITWVYGKNDGIPDGPEREPGERMLPPPPKSQVARSKRLAELIRLAAKKEGVSRVSYVDRGPFAVLKAPEIPSVLVELGNLRDKGERAKLADPAYQNRLAAALAAGIARYLDEKKLRDKAP